MGTKARRILTVYTNSGLYGLWRLLAYAWQTRIARNAILDVGVIAASELSSASKFSEIYKRKLWLKAGAITGERESLSGHGSSLRSTLTLRNDLERFFRENKITSIFDAPCGDFNWMRAVRLPDHCSYFGGDIVASVVKSNRKRYPSGGLNWNGSVQFDVFDITQDQYPRSDLWICKDCLQHLSSADIMKALVNFSQSIIPIALISNHRGVRLNTDICTGDFREVDLTLPPFNLPPPIRILQDDPVDSEDRFVGVWTREQIAAALQINQK